MPFMYCVQNRSLGLILLASHWILCCGRVAHRMFGRWPPKQDFLGASSLRTQFSTVLVFPRLRRALRKF